MDETRDPTPPPPPADQAATTPSGAPRAPSAAPTPLVEVGPTPADRDIAFELVLEFPGREAMQAYALAVGDRSSPDYRHFLTADEIGARFGLSDEALDARPRVGSRAGDRGRRDLRPADHRLGRGARRHRRIGLRRQAARLRRRGGPDLPRTRRRPADPCRPRRAGRRRRRPRRPTERTSGQRLAHRRGPARRDDPQASSIAPTSSKGSAP